MGKSNLSSFKYITKKGITSVNDNDLFSDVYSVVNEYLKEGKKEEAICAVLLTELTAKEISLYLEDAGLNKEADFVFESACGLHELSEKLEKVK